MKNKIIFLATLIASAAAMALPSQQVADYHQRYQLQSTSQKLVDNFGDGYEDLYGTRNLRVVLKGILYRGGANNAYNKYNKRENQNPLPDMGLKNLCQENFKTAVYLYETNFNTAPKVTSCENFEKQPNKINYLQLTAANEDNTDIFLSMVYKAIKGEIGSPLYMHCWNGWHASGLVSALALRQFCKLNADEALQYWTRNTDGHSEGYTAFKSRIASFKARPQFEITEEERAQICLQN